MFSETISLGEGVQVLKVSVLRWGEGGGVGGLPRSGNGPDSRVRQNSVKCWLYHLQTVSLGSVASLCLFLPLCTREIEAPTSWDCVSSKWVRYIKCMARGRHSVLGG